MRSAIRPRDDASRRAYITAPGREIPAPISSPVNLLNIWIVAAAEPLPMLDGVFRPFRCSLLSTALTARGHHVTWWTSDFDHMRKAARFGEFRSIAVGDRLSLNLLPGPSYHRNISLRRMLHHHVMARRFSTEAAQSSSPPDVIFACLPTLELAERAIEYGSSRAIPVIVDIRDLWPDLYLRAFPRWLQAVARLALTPEFRRASRILRAADGITAVSDGYLDWGLENAGRSRRPHDRVFPLGYVSRAASTDAAPEVTRQKHGIPAHALAVTFVGTFGASYDLTTVVAAAAACPSVNGVPVHFILAGDGDERARLQKMAGDADNVTFTGWLDEPEIRALLNASDVGLAAYSQAATQSLPNKLYEYLAAGLPILSSLGGEQQALIDRHHIGLHYTPHHPELLVERVSWLAGHPGERRAMGVRAASLFEASYKADTVYASLAQYIESMAEKRSR